MASRNWAQERAKRKGGSNVRGNKKESWERSRIGSHTRKIKGKRVTVKAYYRHKGKR